jgi:hypothetical protein
MLQVRQLPAFTGIQAVLAANAKMTATCAMQLGKRVHAVHFELGNDTGTAADATHLGPGIGIGTYDAPGPFDECRILIDGNVERKFTISELNEINKVMNQPGLNTFTAKTGGTDGKGIAAGVTGFRTRISIYFAEPWRKGFIQITRNGKTITVPESELTAWNLAPFNPQTGRGIKTCTIELDVIARNGATVTKELDGCVISGTYEFDELTSDDIGTIVKWKRNTFNAGANPYELVTLPTKNGAYQSLHIFATNEAVPCFVRSLMFTRDNVQIRQDVTRAQNDHVLIERNMNPAQGATAATNPVDITSKATTLQTGTYNLVFDYDDPVLNMLSVDGSNELTARLTFGGQDGGAANVPSVALTVISQINGTPD